jgi:hypothetical protein
MGTAGAPWLITGAEVANHIRCRYSAQIQRAQRGMALPVYRPYIGTREPLDESSSEEEENGLPEEPTEGQAPGTDEEDNDGRTKRTERPRHPPFIRRKNEQKKLLYPQFRQREKRTRSSDHRRTPRVRWTSTRRIPRY